MRVAAPVRVQHRDAAAEAGGHRRPQRETVVVVTAASPPSSQRDVIVSSGPSDAFRTERDDDRHQFKQRLSVQRFRHPVQVGQRHSHHVFETDVAGSGPADHRRRTPGLAPFNADLRQEELFLFLI